MYSEGAKVGEKSKTILLKSLLSQNITAAIQRQSLGAVRLPTSLILAVLKSQSASHCETKKEDGLLLQNCIALIAFGYEERKSCGVVICPV